MKKIFAALTSLFLVTGVAVAINNMRVLEVDYTVPPVANDFVKFDGTVWEPSTVNATTDITGTLPVTNGGTGLNTASQGDILYGSAANTYSKLAKDTNATRYLGNTGTSNNPAWAQVNLTNGVTGTLPVTSGGTGIATVAQGDLVFGSASNTISALAKNTSSTRYLSNTGSSNNPAWAQVNVANGVTGTLPIANGGTGVTTLAWIDASGPMTVTSTAGSVPSYTISIARMAQIDKTVFVSIYIRFRLTTAAADQIIIDGWPFTVKSHSVPQIATMLGGQAGANYPGFMVFREATNQMEANILSGGANQWATSATENSYIFMNGLLEVN